MTRSEGVTGREFAVLADHARAAYLRYSFTKGTEKEVAFLTGALRLAPGKRLLDIGCGPGRHVRAFAERGVEVVGVDISASFLRLVERAPRVLADARRLPFAPHSFDAAISLCQGGFGLLGGSDDGTVLAETVRVLRPGGPLAFSAFSSYFAVRYLEDGDTFDAATGVNHEVATVNDESGRPATFDLWTTCFTPRELRLLAEWAGAEVEAIWSVAPGDYATRPPDLVHPEFLLIGRAGDRV